MTEIGGYLVVLLAAATPWVEILLVIPVAIASGLDPVAVGILAFVGNAAPVVAIVAAGERLTAWWDRRRPQVAQRSRRAERARRLLRRYGIPGLALLGPLVIGAHLGALMAMALRPRPVRVIAWMCASLAVWSLALAVVSALGVDLVRG